MRRKKDEEEDGCRCGSWFILVIINSHTHTNKTDELQILCMKPYTFGQGKERKKQRTSERKTERTKSESDRVSSRYAVYHAHGINGRKSKKKKKIELLSIPEGIR